MRKSARILGEQLNITAEEKNELLKLNGLLEGEPGNYQVTATGEPYATENYEHRGTGGYACYNREWTVRTWDDSVMDVLDTSPKIIQEARSNVSERRKARYKTEVADEDEQEVTCEENEGPIDCETSYVDQTDVVKGFVIAIGIFGTIVVAPYVKRFYIEKIKPTCKRIWHKITEKPYKDLNTSEEQVANESN